MKDSLSDQVRKLERENERLKANLEKKSKVRVILKSRDGFTRYEEMLEKDVRPIIRLPAVYRELVDYYKCSVAREKICEERTFVLTTKPDASSESEFDKVCIKTLIYREE